MSRIPQLRTALALATRRPVEGLRDGVHPARATGEGLDFVDLREYVAGDDISRIDWRATARTGDLLVRRDVAERQTTLLLACAAGRSWAGLATPTQSKAEVAAAACGTLGLLATLRQDQVGMVWGGLDGVRASRPSVRTVDLERALDQLVSACTLKAPAQDLAEVLQLASGSLRRPGIVAVLCDDVDIDSDLQARLRRLSVRHEVMVLVVPDVDPTTLSGRSVVSVDDGWPLAADLLADRELAEQWEAEREARARRRTDVLGSLGIRHVELTTVEQAVPQVLELAGRRA